MVAHKKPLVDLATQMIDFIFLQSQDEALHGPLLYLQKGGYAACQVQTQGFRKSPYRNWSSKVFQKGKVWKSNCCAINVLAVF